MFFCNELGKRASKVHKNNSNPVFWSKGKFLYPCDSFGRRIIHSILFHFFKGLRQTAITSKVPATKRSMERYLFHVKALLHATSNGCTFWMGKSCPFSLYCSVYWFVVMSGHICSLTNKSNFPFMHPSYSFSEPSIVNILHTCIPYFHKTLIFGFYEKNNFVR